MCDKEACIVLGVDKIPPKSELKAIYRQRLKMYHPDLETNVERKRVREVQTKYIIEAYEYVLARYKCGAQGVTQVEKPPKFTFAEYGALLDGKEVRGYMRKQLYNQLALVTMDVQIKNVRTGANIAYRLHKFGDMARDIQTGKTEEVSCNIRELRCTDGDVLVISAYGKEVGVKYFTCKPMSAFLRFGVKLYLNVVLDVN